MSREKHTMSREKHSPKTRKTVFSMLDAGETHAKISETTGVPRATISLWKTKRSEGAYDQDTASEATPAPAAQEAEHAAAEMPQEGTQEAPQRAIGTDGAAEHAPPAPSAKTPRSGLLVRDDQVMQRLNVRQRIKGLAARAGASEAWVTRNLLLLALPQAEGEPGRLATAAGG